MRDYEKQISRLRLLGPRTSGSDAHRALVEDIAGELEGLGYDVQRDRHTFDRWDAGPDAGALRIDGIDVPISSPWPYSGETDPAGVTAPLVLLEGSRKRWKTAGGRIAVIEAHNLDVPLDLLLESWDGRLPFDTLRNPVVGSLLAGDDLTKARAAGVLGVVAVWDGLADDVARGQCLPFRRGHQGVPAVWVPQSGRATVLAAARNGATATLTLDARTVRDAQMDTLWTVSPGSGPHTSEAVLVVTHTDGGNAVEENGHIALLALARHAAAAAHDRTIVFVFVAGHLRIPAVTSHGQATTAWLDRHPELWDAASGGLTAVAGLTAEHLGARHFRVDPATGRYGPDGTPEPELLYATTAELATLTRSTWNGAHPDAVTPVKPGALFQFGEGEPLTERGIPGVALVTGPDYLLAELDDDLVDPEVLGRQVDSFRRLLEHLAGDVDRASFGTVRPPTRRQKLVATARVLWFVRRHRGRRSRET